MTTIDAKPFLESYYLANTPDYLLTQLLSNPRLSSIAAQSSVEDLIQAIKDSDAMREPTTLDKVAGYAALVALLSKVPAASQTHLNDWKPTNLRWAPSLIAEWDMFRKPTSFQSMNFATNIPTSAVTSTSSSSSIASYSFPDSDQ